MQKERAFGQFTVKREQIPDSVDKSGAGAAHELAALQTDLLIQDHIGRFIILCPETDLENARFLAERTYKIIEERTGQLVHYGVASFPDEALTFEDLLHLARDRSKQPPTSKKLVEANEQVAK